MDNLTPITREEMIMNDEPLTPITREEKILAGEDLNPVTRREYFLKKYRHAGGDVMVEGLEVTANGTYTAPEGKAYSPVEVAVPLPDNAYLLKTASGSLVSFSDGADLPIPSFICNIDAVQDLHGYDAPWVGGAGKNKLPMTVDEIKAANTSGTWSGNSYTKNNVVFTLNTDRDGNITSIKVNGTNNSSTDSIYFKLAFDITTILFDGTYMVSGCTGGASETYLIQIYASGGSQGNNVIGNFGGDTSIFKDGLQSSYVKNVYITIRPSVAMSNVLFYPMIRLATETDPTFAPYSNICPISGHTVVDAVISPTTEASAGTTYSVSWQTEAGEVFGGYVDLVSGELTAVVKYKLFDGSENWTITSNVYLELSDMKSGARQDGLCNYFPVRKSGDSGDNLKIQFGANGVGANSLYIINAISSGYDTLEKVQALTTGMQIVYPLATPITYQLTPTQIKSLLGNNNAWCDTGEVDADYFAKEV